jgi:hypothetical protein
MCDVISAMLAELGDEEHEETRQRIYARLIDAFEDMDCDTLGECAGDDPAFDRALVDAGHEID